MTVILSIRCQVCITLSLCVTLMFVVLIPRLLVRFCFWLHSCKTDACILPFDFFNRISQICFFLGTVSCKKDVSFQRVTESNLCHILKGLLLVVAVFRQAGLTMTYKRTPRSSIKYSG